MKTVIEMARKSGFLIDGVQEFVFAPSSFHFTEELKLFAELVRADEREAIAKWLEDEKDAPYWAELVRARSNT